MKTIVSNIPEKSMYNKQLIQKLSISERSGILIYISSQKGVTFGKKKSDTHEQS